MKKELIQKLGVLLMISSSLGVRANDPYPKNEAIDIRHYDFHLEVNDSTDIIYGEAFISVVFKKSISFFELDLGSKNASGKGMETIEVSFNGTKLNFTHANDRLKINLKTPSRINETMVIKITYKGEPQDGLIIGKNKYGDRGFFGDNWPDRAHHWLPVVDHPFDKASVDFSITAPVHYSVVANGIKVEESFLSEKRKLTRYHEEIAIPVKVMVVGIARFAVERVGSVENIPVESWVYPQNRTEGFFDYAIATRVLDFFNTHIGEYSYKKLANVQSKTRYGGLENANTIFYYENSVTGKGNVEPLIAHEVAHQWFGNSASEKDWHHVWLSEGFATYFANLYLENVYGHDRLAEEEKKDRLQIIDFSHKNFMPVLDTTITDLMKLLSVNSYQKGGWVLHMLRHEIGDLNFWKGIRQYYATYKNSNALTSDFQRMMEQASEKDLSGFFSQWIYNAGLPNIEVTWHYYPDKKSISFKLNQTQEKAFVFPLEIGIESNNGYELKTIVIDKKSQDFSFPMINKPFNVTLDPNIWLLFEGKIEKK